MTKFFGSTLIPFLSDGIVPSKVYMIVAPVVSVVIVVLNGSV